MMRCANCFRKSRAPSSVELDRPRPNVALAADSVGAGVSSILDGGFVESLTAEAQRYAALLSLL